MPKPLSALFYVVIAFLFLWVFFSGSGGDGGRARTAEWQDWDSVKEIYAFGDSWTTTDFNEFADQPSTKNPMGNPPFPNDPLKKNYITASYNESLIYTYNFAKGAAPTDRHLVEPAFSFTQDLHEQVDNIFLPHYSVPASHAAIWPPRGRLFILFFGVVDVHNSKEIENLDISAHVDAIAVSYQRALRTLYDNGARNVLLINVPPLDIAPSAEKLELLVPLIKTYNEMLLSIRSRMRTTYGDLAVRVFDLHALLTELLRKPTSMSQTRNLKNLTENCWDYNPDIVDEEHPQDWHLYRPQCGVRRDEYFWANPLHVTFPVQEAIAVKIVQDCWNGQGGRYCS